MTIGREQRRAERRTKVAVLFADRTDRVLDLLELLEMAWHDVYGDVTSPVDVVDDIVLLSEGDLELLIRWVRNAVADWRDLRLAADEVRSS
ncbi:MAG TPA: hypothetical protein VK969_10115 [Acidimicrobiia bacterium]|nr:hypothetical protein [Acidimicrobiia bacterium]